MSLVNLSITAIRELIRAGEMTGQTAGLANGYLQANLVILPEKYALDFARYCQRNPKPCPLVGISDSGNPKFHSLGHDLDLTTDVPSYNVYADGKLIDSPTQIDDLWQADFVGFALGCSHTFEEALVNQQFDIWHLLHKKTVPMFKTSIQTVPSQMFSGEMVVTMRAIPHDRLHEAVAISKQFPLAHGAPVHIGNPHEIGITDLNTPDWGDPAPIPEGSTPVFWACGVTPQIAIQNAQLPIAITHKPGSMLITDIHDRAEIPVLNQDFSLSIT